MLSSDSYTKREGRLSGKGTMHAFKVSEAVSSALKRERSDSFVASGARLDVTDEEIEWWLICRWLGVAVTVKTRNQILFWVKPTSRAEFQLLLQNQQGLEGSPLR